MTQLLLNIFLFTTKLFKDGTNLHIVLLIIVYSCFLDVQYNQLFK